MSPRKKRRSKRPPQSPRQPHPPSPRELPSDPPERRNGGPVRKEIREHALFLVASGMKPSEVASQVGVCSETLRLWRRRAEREGTMPKAPEAPSSPQAPKANSAAAPRVPQRAPKDPGSGLGVREVEAVLELKRRHPSMGPAQIRAQLKRFQGWRLSVRAIARVLRSHGFELVHVASRPKGEEEPGSFEAPCRNALWQMDFAELRVGAQRVSLLVVLDDFSRFVVAWDLMDEPSSEKVVEVMREAIRRHGKPEAVYTDRGGPFLAWRQPSAFKAFLEDELIDHHVSPAYRPMGRGKVESLIGTIQRELWEVVHFGSVEEARRSLAEFFRHYNGERAHMGIDGLTPADRFFGRWKEVLEKVEAASRKRNGVRLPGHAHDPFVTEESLPGGPAEVLRLVLVAGRMELRLLGHRIDLGPLKP